MWRVQSKWNALLKKLYVNDVLYIEYMRVLKQNIEMFEHICVYIRITED